MLKILPIASGKGGVGKSVIAANLGVSLALMGKTVVLVDLDLGGSNLHTCIGLRNRHPGLGSYVWKKEKSLAGLLVETGQERLWLVPGDNLLPGTANLEWNIKRRILKDLASLPADYAILDLGAGSSWNVIDFFLATDSGLIVATPEITSILNAYSFLKTAAFRCLSRSFPEGSKARQLIEDYAGSKTEGSGQTFIDFAASLAAGPFPRGNEALLRLRSLSPLVVLNRVRSAQEAELGNRLRDISRKNLGIGLSFAGLLVEDEAVRRSIESRTPLLLLEPATPFARGIDALASRLVAAGLSAPQLGEEGEGIESMAEEAFERTLESGGWA